MSIARDAYEELCRARDAVDAGAVDGPERAQNFRAYLDISVRLRRC